MVKIYITTVSEIAFDKAGEQLSEYRRGKAVRKNGVSSIAAGLLLDYALMEYGLCERDMEYSENEHGKPLFKNRPDIKFSLSHSCDYAVCAVSDKEIGIDIEQERDTKNFLGIAERFFTEREYNHIKSVGDTKSGFFRLWTRKESLLKAIGCGISGGLGSYEVLNDETIVGDTKFYFSEICGYENMSITCCSEETEADVQFVTADMFKTRQEYLKKA